MNQTPPAQPVETVLPPPTERYTVLGWIYKNLLTPWYNALLTILALWLIYAIFTPLLRWTFTQARWEVVAVNLRLLMVGQYPKEQVWRLWLSLHILAFIIGLSWGSFVRGRRWLGLFLLAIPWGLALIRGFSASTRTHLAILPFVALIAFSLARIGNLRVRQHILTLWGSYFILFILLVRGLTPPDSWFPV
ncbi:MAG: hypothetical protein ACK4VW_06390, partial [Anaerolineales bacterium]